MLDTRFPKLDRPPPASTVDAAKARDVDAARFDGLQRDGLRQRGVRARCVVSVRVHLPVILTCCSSSPAEESPLRLRKPRDVRSTIGSVKASDCPAHHRTIWCPI